MKWQRIEDLHIGHDLTQKQAAEILHCQREAYRHYKNGTRELPLLHAITLAQYYNVSLNYIAGLTDDCGSR